MTRNPYLTILAALLLSLLTLSNRVSPLCYRIALHFWRLFPNVCLGRVTRCLAHHAASLDQQFASRQPHLFQLHCSHAHQLYSF